MLGRGHGHAFGHVLAAAANLQVFERAAVAEPVEKQSAAAAATAGNGALVDWEVGRVGVLELRVAVAGLRNLEEAVTKASSVVHQANKFSFQLKKEFSFQRNTYDTSGWRAATDWVVKSTSSATPVHEHEPIEVRIEQAEVIARQAMAKLAICCALYVIF